MAAQEELAAINEVREIEPHRTLLDMAYISGYIGTGVEATEGREL